MVVNNPISVPKSNNNHRSQSGNICVHYSNSGGYKQYNNNRLKGRGKFHQGYRFPTPGQHNYYQAPAFPTKLQVFFFHLHLSPLAIFLLNMFLANCVIHLATLHHFASQNLLRNLVVKYVASIIIPLGFATTMIRVLHILVHNSLNCLMLLQHLNFLHKVQCRLCILWLLIIPTFIFSDSTTSLAC